MRKDSHIIETHTQRLGLLLLFTIIIIIIIIYFLTCCCCCCCCYCCVCVPRVKNRKTYFLFPLYIYIYINISRYYNQSNLTKESHVCIITHSRIHTQNKTRTRFSLSSEFLELATTIIIKAN